MKIVMIILIIVLSLQAKNGEKLYIMLYSFHHSTKQASYEFSPNYDFKTNPYTFGIGYERTFKSGFGLQFGAYYNSYSKPSMLVGVHYEKQVVKDLYLGASLSAASGYKEALGNSIIAIPMISVRYKYFRVLTTFPISELMNKRSVTNLQVVIPF